MKLTTSFLVVAGIGILAACHGTPNLVPLAPQQEQPSATTLRSLHIALPGFASRTATCTTPVYKPPGPFIIFVANGNIKHGNFASKSGASSIWVEIKVKRATKPTPPPTPGPSTAPSPTAPPTNQPLYFYIGQYTLVKTKQSGCAFLFATQNGKPFTGSKTGALAAGLPQVKYPKYYKDTIVTEGPLSLKLSKLSATGGSGVGTLLLKTGGTFDTANVTLTYRISEP